MPSTENHFSSFRCKPILVKDNSSLWSWRSHPIMDILNTLAYTGSECTEHAKQLVAATRHRPLITLALTTKKRKIHPKHTFLFKENFFDFVANERIDGSFHV